MVAKSKGIKIVQEDTHLVSLRSINKILSNRRHRNGNPKGNRKAQVLNT